MNFQTRSSTALHIRDNEHIYLIEFKNARKSRISKKWLHEKAYDSIFTLQLAFFPNWSLEELKKRVSLIFVYNDDGVIEKEQESAAFDALKDKMYALSGGGRNVLFGLDIFRDVIYKQVLTVEKNVFMSEIHQCIFG